MIEKIFNLNTLEGQSSFMTQIIKGEINQIIIESKERCEVIIESAIDYLIMQRREHKGIICYGPRMRTSAPLPSLMDQTHFDKFTLNERLFLTVRGVKNLDVKITIRLQ